mmetsp:Transcript_8380/g.52364  ORF Transcript_8380/g.52364 Transcript_8380/m.52364 type:complete len:260 (+) Transcript_8380:183-962(+)
MFGASTDASRNRVHRKQESLHPTSKMEGGVDAWMADIIHARSATLRSCFALSSWKDSFARMVCSSSGRMDGCILLPTCNPMPSCNVPVECPMVEPPILFSIFLLPCFVRLVCFGLSCFLPFSSPRSHVAMGTSVVPSRHACTSPFGSIAFVMGRVVEDPSIGWNLSYEPRGSRHTWTRRGATTRDTCGVEGWRGEGGSEATRATKGRGWRKRGWMEKETTRSTSIERSNGSTEIARRGGRVERKKIHCNVKWPRTCSTD